jgi:signal transduction histidine kinase
MARRPALARLVRRPGPLVLDVVLALVLAAFSLVSIETGGKATSHADDMTLRLSTTPEGLRPGSVWRPDVVLLRGGRPETAPATARPLLTIQNTTTGAWKTYEAKPTGTPGTYRLRVVIPREGVYAYGVLYPGFEDRVTIGNPRAPSRLGPSPREVQAAVEKGQAAAARGDAPSGWLVALALLATLPVALRRRYPIPVLAVTLGAAIASALAMDNFLVLGALVAVYSVAAHVGRPASLVAAGGVAAGLTVLYFAGDNFGAIEMAAAYAVCAAAWLLGDNMRTRRAYLRGLEERAERLEREREADARRAAAEEQARIARELHDIIAHNVSIMTVQAAAAGDAFERHPARVREALGAIESTGREALTELRRLLGAVRPDEGETAFAPQPGLARLDALVDQVRAAGLTVELIVEGRRPELPPSVDLSAYRIVQEALTNTLKHAGASRARVVVRQGDGALEIEVVDDGRGAVDDGAPGGHGIIGMRERAALFGGDLDAGPAPGGGFAVHARIPLEAVRS